MMKHLNKVNRPLLIQVPIHPKLNQADFQKAIDNNLLVIDTRKKEQVAKGYVPNSLHIENGKSLSTWVGSLVDYQQQIVLITDENQTEDLTRKLMRIGMDNIYGFVTDLEKMNIAVEKSDLVTIDELKKHLDKISKDKTVIIHCQSGVRAAMGTSILKRNGFKNIKNYSGGINEWSAQKNELVK